VNLGSEGTNGPSGWIRATPDFRLGPCRIELAPVYSLRVLLRPRNVSVESNRASISATYVANAVDFVV
jgi:hypothetical protein